ncbi:MAG: hypothetical protein KKD07_02590, partial [Candidatus Omnitrophica bacterium]|nr:hypothetical protein [Candidatus Omnitrophota bacterium]
LEETRLKQEIQSEKIQAGSAHDYIKTLQLFNDFYLMNKDNRERIQAILPRMINSVICYITDKKKGIGRLKIGLFGRPFDRGQNAEIWNETLQKIADECYNNKVLENIEKLAPKSQGKVKVVSLRKAGSSSATCTAGKRFYASNSSVRNGEEHRPHFCK